MSHNGPNIGSGAVRNTIEKIQPIITLHGHVHESPYISGDWVEHIGETICVNPGQGDKLPAVIVDLISSNEVYLKHTIFGEY